MVIKKFLFFVFVLSYPNHKLMKNMNIDKVVQPVQLRNMTWEEKEGYVGGEPGCEGHSWSPGTSDMAAPAHTSLPCTLHYRDR